MSDLRILGPLVVTFHLFFPKFMKTMDFENTWYPFNTLHVLAHLVLGQGDSSLFKWCPWGHEWQHPIVNIGVYSKTLLKSIDIWHLAFLRKRRFKFVQKIFHGGKNGSVLRKVLVKLTERPESLCHATASIVRPSSIVRPPGVNVFL